MSAATAASNGLVVPIPDDGWIWNIGEVIIGWGEILSSQEKKTRLSATLPTTYNT
jgi:hypothetical protein